MITAVILNWKRPQNLEAATKGIRLWDRVSEVILWNNNPEDTLVMDGNDPRVTVINSGKNYSCWTRYAVALLAKNDTLLFHDDDLYVTTDQLEKMFAAYQKDAWRIYGIVGRSTPYGWLYNEGQRAAPVSAGEADIVLGRAMLFHRALLLRSLMHMNPPYTVDDDVAFSLASYKATSKKPFVVDVGEIAELSPNDEVASWRQADFQEIRQRTFEKIGEAKKWQPSRSQQP